MSLQLVYVLITILFTKKIIYIRMALSKLIADFHFRVNCLFTQHFKKNFIELNSKITNQVPYSFIKVRKFFENLNHK